MELKFASNSYFKQLFQNLRPKLQYSKNTIFVTSHIGTLLKVYHYSVIGSLLEANMQDTTRQTITIKYQIDGGGL